MNFPDQIHVELIRRQLWKGREYGQAAVMIGAGFSLNADKINAHSPSFPTWITLAEKIYDALYLDGDDSRRKVALSGNGLLKIASEYMETFGRDKLDELVIQSLPEDRYNPGRLHRLLMSIPWSDVFTTNYDTLLERTLPSIHDRKYDVVYTAADLPSRAKPRIVKLNGSLPSNRPFILTEEDFRTYPVKFAPFVNTVQQSMMENTFCLLGFSGDDPNFQYWAGWVRDYLGNAAPKIYLCGLLQLSNTQRKWLESKNIIPVDLTPIVEKASLNPHAVALEWFLCSLLNGKPSNSNIWPKCSKPLSNVISVSQMTIPPIPSTTRFVETEYHRAINFDIKGIKQLTNDWIEIRNRYPGWVVCPKDKRDEIFNETDNEINNVIIFLKKFQSQEFWTCKIVNSENSFTPIDKLFLLYELNWRLEIAMNPFQKEIEVEVESTILKFNPFPAEVNLDEAIITPAQGDCSQLPWNDIQVAWIELLFALARDARESFDEKKFERWMALLKNAVHHRDEWLARWHYEQCLFSLFHLDWEKLGQRLDSWPLMSHLPFWEVKKASILVEIDEFDRAKQIAEQALERIRSQTRPYDVDYELASQEAWTMVLLKGIADLLEPGKSKERISEFRERWERLAYYRCTPWDEIEWLENSLKHSTPKPTPNVESKKDFEGHISYSYHFSSGFRTKQFLPAFAMMRIHEIGALPVRCGGIRSQGTVHAAEWIELFYPEWAVTSIIRAGGSERLKENKWFNKAQIGCFTEAIVEKLEILLRSALIQAVNHQIQNPIRRQYMLCGVVPIPIWTSSKNIIYQTIELISRLCLRYSTEQIERLFNLIIALYEIPIFRNDWELHEPISKLFKQLFKSASIEEIKNKLLTLLDLPICGERNFLAAQPDKWDDPFLHLAGIVEKIEPSESKFNIKLITDRIEDLLQIIAKKRKWTRKAAIYRLMTLYYLNYLTQNQINSFAHNLWSKIDINTGLPIDTGLYLYSLLLLPEPEPNKTREAFRKYLLSETVPIKYSTDSKGAMLTWCDRGWFVTNWLRGTTSLFYNDRNDKLIDWSSEDAKCLLLELISWWHADKPGLKGNSAIMSSDHQLRLDLPSIDVLLACVVLPRFEDADEDSKNQVKELLDEMETENIPILRALPMMLFPFPEMFAEIVRKLRKGLSSPTEDQVVSAVEGLVRWIAYAEKGQLPAPPKSFLDELVNKITTRRFPALDTTIMNMKLVLKCFLNLLGKEHIESLLIALEYLFEETYLPEDVQFWFEETGFGAITFSDRPKYRLLCSKLAFQLFVLLKNRQEEIPKILHEWRDASLNDPFPEVRRVWIQTQ